MVAVIARRRTEESGLRPMEPARDLAGHDLELRPQPLGHVFLRAGRFATPAVSWFLRELFRGNGRQLFVERRAL